MNNIKILNSVRKNKADREQIVEIKKGQTGTGLLIENDGHITGKRETVSQIREDIENGHKFVIPDDFVVSAVFQKYGIKNANGRIYPEAILKREVQKYIENQIAMHTAIGSLDHPSCQLSDTMVLTKYGWKPIAEISIGEEIMTVNESKEMEIKPVLKKIEEHYSGKLIHFKGRSIDLKVTPNHKFPLLNRHKKWIGFHTAQEIFDGKVPDQGHCSFFKTGAWNGAKDEYFTLQALSDDELATFKHERYKEKYSKDMKIPMDVWAKFLGIYLSEGDCSYKVRGENNGSVNIHQVKEDTVKEIEEMLNEFPMPYNKNVRSGHTSFSIYDMRLAKYLKQFGGCYEKYVPFEMKKQCKETLNIFYEWFVKGDGRKRGIGNGNYYSDDVFSTSKQLVMDLNEIQLKIGYAGSYHEEDRHKDRMIEGRLIKAENSHNMFFSMRSFNKHISLNKKSLTVTEEDYDGMVYCVEVENHTFYTMCNNGKCLWSGNSSTLSGHDVTHRILDLRWEGRTLVGEMKLHLSPGFKKYGVCSTSGDLAACMVIDGIRIGVSSRGVGSVIEKFGQTIVDNDFELISWDIVMEPSTPNAWISQEPSELERFIESHSKETDVISEKIEKLKKIIE